MIRGTERHLPRQHGLRRRVARRARRELIENGLEAFG